MASTRRASSTHVSLARAVSSIVGSRPQLLQQLARNVPHPRHRFHHVDRDADRAALVGDRAGDGLANPPGGVGAELEAAAVLELIDRPHQPRVALLDQVEEA